jgi:hypothetical protein
MIDDDVDVDYRGVVGVMNPKYLEVTCTRAALSITNSTLLELGSNRNRRGGKPASNRLS